MRLLPAFFLLLLLVSCGSDPVSENVSASGNLIDTNLRVPTLNAGMPVDTTLPALRIYAVSERLASGTGQDTEAFRSVQVEAPAGPLTEAVNVYADSIIPTEIIDSVINVHCGTRDLRLIGISNGIELAIPFHGLHRFRRCVDTIERPESEFHLVFVNDNDLEINDWSTRYTDPEKYFRLFYGDAFNPTDSSARFPQRKANRQSVEGLMEEGVRWDLTDIKRTPDTAAALAAYNEFVNKLEIYDKAGSFCTMREAVMDADPFAVTWARTMHVFGVHYAVVDALRESAKQYLADKIANEGDDPNKQFTDEDLRLLYPDRLRWNGRVSGVYEHRYDPYLLAEWRWILP